MVDEGLLFVLVELSVCLAVVEKEMCVALVVDCNTVEEGVLVVCAVETLIVSLPGERLPVVGTYSVKVVDVVFDIGVLVIISVDVLLASMDEGGMLFTVVDEGISVIVVVALVPV